MAVIWNRWTIVITLLVITVLYVDFIPFGKGTALRKDLSLFPAALDGWVQIRGGETVEFNSLPPAEFYISRTFQNDKNELVSLNIGYWGKFRHRINVFEGKNIAPGKNWSSSDSSAKRIDVGGHSIKVNEISFKKGNDYVLVTYWYFMGNTGATNKGIGRLQHAFSAMLNQRSDVALIIVSSPYDSPAELNHYQDSHARFVKAMVPALTEFLPYEL
jgi:EpsI family protein